jgi:anthranilate synthase component 2
VEVVRNDQIPVEEIERIDPAKIVISPGPCTPKEAGTSVETIRRYAGRYPILGVCLGHQSIGYAFGGHVIHAKRIMHGKTSMVHHHDRGVFHGLSNPFQATRYHSLVIEQSTRLADCLGGDRLDGGRAAAAWRRSCGVRHKTLDVEGVQFHPESILDRAGA